MNTLKIVIVCGIAPLSAYLSQSNHQSLWGVLFLSNPFTIFLLISSLAKSNNNSYYSGYKLGTAPTSSSAPIDRRGPAAANLASPRLPKPTFEFDDSHGGDPANNSGRTLFCCSKDRDTMYWFYKYLMYSTHLTLLWITRDNLVYGLQVSSKELCLLYGSYTLLICFVLNLKSHICRIRERCLSAGRPSMDSTAAQQLLKSNRENDEDKISTSGHPENNRIVCEQICFLKLLAHPKRILKRATTNNFNSSVDQWRRNHSLSSPSTTSASRPNGSPTENQQQQTIEVETLPIPYVHMDQLQYNGQQVNELHMVERASRLYAQVNRRQHHSSGSILARIIQPTSAPYLAICNFIHLFIMLQYTYLNITFTCASKPSRFGLVLLIPYDCSAVFDMDNNQARLSMFAAIASAQILICQLVMQACSKPIMK
jgi:hypothetical protein